MEAFYTWKGSIHAGLLYMETFYTWRRHLHEGVLFMEAVSTWKGPLKMILLSTCMLQVISRREFCAWVF